MKKPFSQTRVGKIFTKKEKEIRSKEKSKIGKAIQKTMILAKITMLLKFVFPSMGEKETAIIMLFSASFVGAVQTQTMDFEAAISIGIICFVLRFLWEKRESIYKIFYP